MNSNSSKVLRFLTFTFPKVIIIENDGYEDGKCSMTGYVGSVLNDVAQKIIKQLNLTCTMTAQSDFGSYDPTTKMYDGMLGAVARKEHDLLMAPVYYPLNDPDDMYFAYASPLSEDRVILICPYEIPVKDTEGDILYMFTAINSIMWIGFFTGYFMFVVILQLGKIYGNKSLENKSTTWLVSSALLSEDNIPDDSKFTKLVNFIMAIFIFFFMNYLLNCMSTDLVLYKDPPVITSYEEFLATENMTAYLIPGFPLESEFKNSPPGSIERQIYDRHDTIGINYAKLISELPKKIFNQKIIYVGRQFVGEYAINGMFSIAKENDGFGFRNFDKVRALISSDSRSKKYTNVIVYGKHMDPRIQDLGTKKILSFFEFGISERIFSKLYSFASDSAELIRENKVRTQVVVEDEPVMPFLKFDATKIFFVIFFSMIAFSTLVLLAEKCIMKNWKKNVSKIHDVIVKGRRSKKVVPVSNSIEVIKY